MCIPGLLPAQGPSLENPFPSTNGETDEPGMPRVPAVSPGTRRPTPAGDLLGRPGTEEEIILVLIPPHPLPFLKHTLSF